MKTTVNYEIKINIYLKVLFSDFLTIKFKQKTLKQILKKGWCLNLYKYDTFAKHPKTLELIMKKVVTDYYMPH